MRLRSVVFYCFIFSVSVFLLLGCAKEKKPEVVVTYKKWEERTPEEVKKFRDKLYRYYMNSGEFLNSPEYRSFLEKSEWGKIDSSVALIITESGYSTRDELFEDLRRFNSDEELRKLKKGISANALNLFFEVRYPKKK